MPLSAQAIAAGTYDYVIAGGGTAGLTLAARLTENPQVSVAVIEAGEDRSGDLAVQAWGLAASMLGNPLYDWAFSTTPQARTHDDDRVISWPRGKQLGGSSGTNFWYWNRASQADIDGWATLGNPGWDWASLFPYYLKAETYFAPSQHETQDLDVDYIVPADHGITGPIGTSFPPSYGQLGEFWNPTFKKLGLSGTGDPYGGDAIGAFTTLISQDPKKVSRSYATTAYYQPSASRPNLKVLTGALVNKIVFGKTKDSNGDLVATGLNFTAGGASYVVSTKANGEVILSAGVTQSPQLLELSGIGGAKLLQSFGIPVLVDNPNVGENLQDHQFTSLSFHAAPGGPTLDEPSNATFHAEAVADYEANRTGILVEATCSTAYLSVAQLLKTTKFGSIYTPNENAAQVSSHALATNPGLTRQYALVTEKLLDPNQPFTQELYSPAGLNFPPAPGAFVTLFGLLSHPYSRGSIHINSSDPTVYPTIDPQFLSSPVDLAILSTLALHLQTVAQTQPFASLLQGNGTVYAPNYQALTLDNVEQHVRNTLGEFQHPTGTCALEPRDQGGVVDPNLVVYGTKNVRVVDASIIPIQPVGTIQSLVYAIAEKAADLIKQGR